uniref:Extradiol ring-cleavage dioxygenase n=2 Tax=Cacopsylla melanoneura TaxID=428564 RepID=A0A8D8VNV6_9HEMI
MLRSLLKVTLGTTGGVLLSQAVLSVQNKETSTMNHTKPMPTIYIPHGGGPCFFMEWDPPDNWNSMKHYLEQLEKTLPRKPSSILLISAHWNDAPVFTVGSGERPQLIYDYYGFPDHTYKLKYDAPGNPSLAKQVKELIAKTGIPVKEDPSRGYDHGVFIPLKVIFPVADIPIVTLSLRSDLDPTAHIAVGKALESLRSQDVLIVGSGMSFHNMRGYNPRFYEASKQFDDYLNTAAESDEDTRNGMLTAWSNAPGGRQSHPYEDHLMPLLVVAGAGGKDIGKRVYSDKVSDVIISGYQFG